MRLEVADRAKAQAMQAMQHMDAGPLAALLLVKLTYRFLKAAAVNQALRMSAS